MNRLTFCPMNLTARGSRPIAGLRMTLRVIVLMTCCTIAWAQNELTLPRPLLKEESEADHQFFEAKQKAAEQKWSEALRLFERAWNLKPSYDIAGNLGQVALKLGLYTKAATYLDRCLHLFPATGSSAQRSQVESLFRDASMHVAAVHFRLASGSGELVLDRVVELGSARDPVGTVYVNPGTHIVQVRQGGQVIVEQSFLAVANASQQVHVGTLDESTHSLTPQASRASAGVDSVATGTSESRRASQSRSAVPIVIGAGVSVASFIAAGALLSSAHHSVDHSNDLMSQIPNKNCTGNANPDLCQQLLDAQKRADSRFNWGYAMLGVGGVSLAATIVYGLWPASRSRRDSGGTLDRQVPVDIQVASGRGIVTLKANF